MTASRLWRLLVAKTSRGEEETLYVADILGYGPHDPYFLVFMPCVIFLWIGCQLTDLLLMNRTEQRWCKSLQRCWLLRRLTFLLNALSWVNHYGGSQSLCPGGAGQYALMSALAASLLGPAKRQFMCLVPQLMLGQKYPTAASGETLGQRSMAAQCPNASSKRNYEIVHPVCFKLPKFGVTCYTTAGKCCFVLSARIDSG